LPQGFEVNPHLHAYLVLSSDYTVRTETASLIAKSMLCTGKKDNETQPCGCCPHCIKLEAHTHPDCIYVGKGAKTSVEDIRAIENEAYLAPNESDSKVFVLENADEYNVQSQNALLKIIEEPPINVRFVFTASSAGGILPTVRSRVCTLTGELPAAEVLWQQIKKEKSTLSQKQIEGVAAFVQSFDKTAVKDLDEGLLFEYKELAVQYFNGAETNPVMKFPVKREELMLCLQVFMLAAGEICRAKNSVKGSGCFLTDEETASCVRRTSLKKAHAVYDVLEEGYILTEGYANINAVISYLWQSIR